MPNVGRRGFAVGLGLCCAAPGSAAAQVRRGIDRTGSHHPLFGEAMDQFSHRRWRRLAASVRALPPQSAFVLIDEMGDATQIDASLDGLAREPMGATIAGGLLVNWGWRFRGTGYGSTVGPSAFTAFQGSLQRARDSLSAALASDADDGVAAAFLIRTEKGRQDLAAVDDAFHRLEGASRRPIAGYAGYADAISGKWYGSQQRMLGFARQHRNSLSPSSQGLIPQAHNETMFSLVRSSNAERAARSASYFSEDFVRGELIAANDAFHAVSPDIDHYANRFAYGEFSYAFMQMGERDLARPHVVGMGHAPAGPWALLSDADQVLQRLRLDLGVSDL